MRADELKAKSSIDVAGFADSAEPEVNRFVGSDLFLPIHKFLELAVGYDTPNLFPVAWCSAADTRFDVDAGGSDTRDIM